jgi:KUP system potassium uptake protein
MKKTINGLKAKITAGSLLIALGIIYGDIGTSPLYVLKAIVGKRSITEELVLGGISCVFWTLLIQTTIKYIWLTLKADNQGEGGIFSLYALVRKHGKWLVIPTILGATTLLADGIITPPISVASAVEGLSLMKSLGEIPVVPIVIIILSILFYIQRFGTQKVGIAFGPVMLIWFSMLLILGVNQIAHFPSVFKALSPHYAYNLLVNYPHGFWILGAVFLATTGAEALYSDLGHCGRKNIRITWGFVKVSLVLNYLGQGAWLLHQGVDKLDGINPFFGIVPSWFLLPSVLIATSAAIIASQALISGSYTLINEAMNLNFWPRVAVRQPSENKGQIYISSVNTILWIGCILMIIYFKSSTHMEAAYGFSITVAMLMTTILLCYFLRYRLKWNRWLVLGVLLVFSTVEWSFFIANVAKIKERWMFLFFELFIFLVMYVWFYARKINNKFTRFVDLGKFAPPIKDLSEDESIPKFATHLIYLTKADHRHEIEEKIMKSIFAKKPKRADVYWFVHINRTESPYTLEYDVTELIDDKLIKINIHIGFKIHPKTELYFKQIVQDLVQNKELNLHTRPDGSTKYNQEPDFKFIVFKKFLSVENELGIRDGFLLKSYFLLKKMGQSDERAFGLDKSDTEVEKVPLLLSKCTQFNLTRNQ